MRCRTKLWLALACVCQAATLGARTDGAERAVPRPRRAAVDVALKPGNWLQGQVVDAAGACRKKTLVTVWSGREVVGRTTTDRQGRFALRIPRPGFYALSDGRTWILARLWSHRAAPPSAHRQILIVTSERAVRGQAADRRRGTEAAIITVGTAGVVYRVLESLNDAS